MDTDIRSFLLFNFKNDKFLYFINKTKNKIITLIIEEEKKERFGLILYLYKKLATTPIVEKNKDDNKAYRTPTLIEYLL